MGFGQWAWYEARPSLSKFTSTVRLINSHLNLTKTYHFFRHQNLSLTSPLGSKCIQVQPFTQPQRGNQHHHPVPSPRHPYTHHHKRPPRLDHPRLLARHPNTWAASAGWDTLPEKNIEKWWKTWLLPRPDHLQCQTWHRHLATSKSQGIVSNGHQPRDDTWPTPGWYLGDAFQRTAISKGTYGLHRLSSFP